MINNLILKNFKSHKHTDIKFENLTVLCGINGVGKSSLVQSLLLIRESYINDGNFEILDLKSNSVKIGTLNDAIYEFGDNDGFEVNIEFSFNNKINLKYDALSENEKAKSFVKLNKKDSKIDNEFKYNKMSLFNSNFQYISAARLGPQEQYPKDDKIIDIDNQISKVEGMAEYFVHFLDKNRNIDVLHELCVLNNQYKDLYTQVVLWEKYIFNGANTEVQDLGKLGYMLKYSFSNSNNKTSSFDAKNVGFGLTYTLPILVAILSSKKDGIVIIENPESHLHPSGISRLTELICAASQVGIQIIIETHSDHVINGILVQSKYFEDNHGNKGICNDNISIYQIDREEHEHCSIATKINVENDGRIFNKPIGFFDQITNDLRELF
jgi:predicted ATPase